uniref:Fascin n=1 Tax=Halisarca dujardinii TaxID=2583056 RepID=A0A9F1UC76_HALDU|nr:fascin [Halisarca dujardinii]
MAAGGNVNALKWTLGLINCGNKYLTAESFQSKINCNGASMRKKQIWTLEGVDDVCVAFKSSLGRYLGTDKDGKINAGYEGFSDETKFEISSQDDGKIAILNKKTGRYFGGTGDQLNCFYKEIANECLFTIHLAMHPMINLYNVNRRAFAHLVAEEVRVDEVIPWGKDALMVVEFHNGKYAVRTSNNMYVERSGKLLGECTPETLYTLVFRNNQVAFRDCKGKFLSGVGACAVLQSRKDTIGKDELFMLHDSNSQVHFRTNGGKFVSIHDGIEVRANQPQVTDTEIFEVEAVDKADMSGNVKWAIRANNKKYWSAAGINIVCNCDNYSQPDCQFEAEWLGNQIALKTNKGSYVSVKANGQLVTTGVELKDECKLEINMLNRPVLVLRCEHGFVGAKPEMVKSTGALVCNKSNYDVYEVTGGNGIYTLKGANGKSVKLEDDGTLNQNGADGTNFYFEFRAHSRMCIVAPNGCYLEADQNGLGFAAKGKSVTKSTLWEY